MRSSPHRCAGVCVYCSSPRTIAKNRADITSPSPSQSGSSRSAAPKPFDVEVHHAVAVQVLHRSPPHDDDDDDGVYVIFISVVEKSRLSPAATRSERSDRAKVATHPS